jgi:cell division protein FtsW
MKVAITLLVGCVAALLALGMVMLYSSSMTQVGAHYLIMQLVWCGLGLVACLAMTSLDYALLKKFVWPLLILSIVLLVLVFVPKIGVSEIQGGKHVGVGGAKRWISLELLHFRNIRFQPSELAKLALIVVVAWYSERFQRQMRDWTRGILIPGAILLPVLLLIFIEPDRGATILMCAVISVMLLIAGVRWQYFAVPVVLGGVGLGLSLWHDPMRMKRIFAWLYLEENKSGVGYQAYQAMLALGSGGWTGLGLGNGRQKLGFVPEHHTDFILSIIGEELGLVATLLVVLAFIIIICCGIYIALHARENFGLLLGCGITFLIGFQAFINIGVVTSALPNKGLPLPFISYGGSNLLMMLACVGVLLSIARHAREPAARPEAAFAPDNPFSPRTT